MTLFLPRTLYDFSFFQAAKLSSNQSLVNTNKMGNIPASYPLFVMVTSTVMRPLFLVPRHLTACFIAKWPISWSWIWHQEMALIVDNQLLACHAGEYQQLVIVKILQNEYFCIIIWMLRCYYAGGVGCRRCWWQLRDNFYSRQSLVCGRQGIWNYLNSKLERSVSSPRWTATGGGNRLIINHLWV